MVAVAPAGAEDPAAEVREDPAGSEVPGESGGKVTRPQWWQKRNCCQKRTRRNERLQKNKSHGHSDGNSLRCAPIRAATGSPDFPNPCASGFALRISEFSALAPGRLLVRVAKSPATQKGKATFPL